MGGGERLGGSVGGWGPGGAIWGGEGGGRGGGVAYQNRGDVPPVAQTRTS